MNQIWILTYLDEDQVEHEDFFPTREEAENHVEYLKEEFVVSSYEIKLLPKL